MSLLARWLFKLQSSVVIFLIWLPIYAEPLDGFHRSNQFDDQIREMKLDDVRIVIDAASNFDPKKPTQLIIYALPNGNSIEQTIGCTEQQGVEWHYFIQQIGAQTRALRAIDAKRNIVVAYVE